MALGQLVIDLQLSMANFVSGIAKVNSHLGNMQRSINMIKGSAFVYLSKQALDATNAIMNFGRSVASSANDIQRQADVVGMSTSEFQQWNYVAKMADIETQSLMMGFRMLAKNISDAGEGTGQAAVIFSKLGISTKNADGSLKSINQITKELAITFPKLGGDTEQLAAAMDLVGGRSGAAFTQLFKLGGAGIDKLIQQFKDMGFEIDESWIKRLSESENAFKQLGFAGAKLRASLVPVIEEIADFTSKVAQNTMLWMKLYETNQMNLAVKELYDLKIQLKETDEELSKMQEEGPTLVQRIFGTYEGNVVYLETLKNKLGTKIKEIQESWKIPAKAGTAEIVDKRMAQEMAYAKEGVELAKLYKEGWLESYDSIVDAMKALGQISEITLKAQAQDAMVNLGIVKAEFEKTGKGVRDYVNALKAADAALKKLTGEDVMQERLDAETEYQQKAREVSRDDEDRQKKINKLIDDYFNKIKEIEKKAIPVHADVAPLESEINESIRKLQAKGIIIPEIMGGMEEGKEKIEIIMDGILYKYEDIKDKIKSDPVIPKIDESKIEIEMNGILFKYNEIKDTIEKSPIQVKIKKTETGGGGGAVTTTPTIVDYMKGGGMGGQTDIGGMGATIDRVSQQIRDVEAHGMTIPIYGEGSSKKPITDKIKEIIDQFGGLDKALIGMEAKINVAELSLEYKRLEDKLNDINQAFIQTSNMMFLHGYSYKISDAQQAILTRTNEDMMAQMKILQMKMEYETFKGYGGSMQSGGVVPRTGLYKLHEGERVTSKSVSMGNININLPMGSSKEQAKEIAKQLALIIKYKRSGDLAEYV